MKRTAMIAATAVLATASLCAQARNEVLKMPIESALAAIKNGKAEGKFDDGIKLYFLGQATPKAAQTLGTFTSNKKTNFFNKSDQEGCEWAFASAVISLQERAAKEGGNAVVDIYSYYKKDEFKSATEYQCVAGTLLGGVTLRGTVVQLK